MKEFCGIKWNPDDDFDSARAAIALLSAMNSGVLEGVSDNEWTAETGHTRRTIVDSITAMPPLSFPMGGIRYTRRSGEA